MQVLLRRDVYRALSSVSGFVGNAAAQLQQAAGEDVAELAEVRPGGIRTSSRAYAPRLSLTALRPGDDTPKAIRPIIPKTTMASQCRVTLSRVRAKLLHPLAEPGDLVCEESWQFRMSRWPIWLGLDPTNFANFMTLIGLASRGAEAFRQNLT